MQYTICNASECKHEQCEQFKIELSDLFAAFATLPDPRRAQGRVYWLPSVLCLAVAAILCNCLSVLAIAEWASGLSPEFRHSLGLPIDRSPDQSTLHRLFRRLDPHQLNSALTEYFERTSSQSSKSRSRQKGHLRYRAEQAIAVDGKARKGQLQFEGDNACTIHDVEAFCHDMGIVLAQAQLALDNQGGEAELTGAPKLVKSISWQEHQLARENSHRRCSLLPGRVMRGSCAGWW